MMFVEVFPFLSMEIMVRKLGESMEKALFIAQNFPVLYILLREGMEGNCGFANFNQTTVLYMKIQFGMSCSKCMPCVASRSPPGT
jgi:hypothetical protein